MRNFIAALFCNFFLLGVMAQGESSLANLAESESKLFALRSEILKAKNDSDRVAANQLFLQQFEEALNIPESYSYPFESLESIALLTDTDNEVRIISWNLPFDDGTHQYFGFVQIAPGKKSGYRYFILSDKSNSIKSADHKLLDHKNWFGALYYEVIPVKYKQQKYYILLGWDGNDGMTSRKIIEVMNVSENGIKFGDNVFRKTEKRSPRRIIFEYSSDATMSLRFNPKKKQIVFDHLSPDIPEHDGQLQYYGPDLSFDAFQQKRGKWIYIPDVDARMEKTDKK